MPQEDHGRPYRTSFHTVSLAPVRPLFPTISGAKSPSRLHPPMARLKSCPDMIQTLALVEFFTASGERVSFNLGNLRNPWITSDDRTAPPGPPAAAIVPRVLQSALCKPPPWSV